jgi:hypothetical protein
VTTATPKTCCQIDFKNAIKADLHYGDYHSKLVHFEGQKNYVLKKPSLERFSP